MTLKSIVPATIVICGLLALSGEAQELHLLDAPLIDHPVAQPSIPKIPHEWRSNVGAWGESVVQQNLKFQGYNEIHQVRKAGNQGIDHIAIKRGPNGEILDARIVETKTHRGTMPKLGDTKAGKQMSEQWITNKLNDIKASKNPRIRGLGEELDAFRQKKGTTFQQMGEVHDINTRTGKYIRRNPETLGELSSEPLHRLLKKLQKRGSQKTQDWATKTLSEWDQIRATQMKEWTGRVSGTEILVLQHHFYGTTL